MVTKEDIINAIKECIKIQDEIDSSDSRTHIKELKEQQWNILEKFDDISINRDVNISINCEKSLSISIIDFILNYISVYIEEEENEDSIIKYLNNTFDYKVECCLRFPEDLNIRTKTIKTYIE